MKSVEACAASKTEGGVTWHHEYRNSRDVLNKPIIVPDQEAAKAVKHVFELAAAGVPQSQLIHEANDLGLKLSRNGISKMLRNPVYCGKILVPLKR